MNMIRVIFVHGISPNVISTDYAIQCTTALLKKLTQYGVIPEGATPEEVAQIISFEQVNYSMIGHEAQQRLLAAYHQESEKLYSLVHRINRISGMDAIRRTIITSVSDVMVYKSEPWRKQIQQTLVDKIDPYVGSGDSVTLIAHSLGSVVAFETLYDNVRFNPKWLAANFKPTNLFTMGSPIALFSLDMDMRFGEHNPEPGDLVIPHAEPVSEEGVWYNFLDAQDLIAYPLEVLFADRFKLQDIVVQTGTNPGKAHIGYWDNDEVTDYISGRLKLDFQRVNAGQETSIVQTPTTIGEQATIKAEVDADDSLLARLLDL